jgi:hypothetical protein
MAAQVVVSPVILSSTELVSARVGALMIVLTVLKDSEDARLSDFEGERVVGTRLAGASVTKTVAMIGLSRATVTRNIMGRQHRRWGTVGESRHGREARTIVSRERDGTTAQVTAQVSICRC